MYLSLLAKKEKKNNNGTILIVTLWVLVILTFFAIALGQRASLELKLAEYQRDKLRAIELAKAAIERAILEKKNDPLADVDALSESWANNAAAFKDFELGDDTFAGTFTTSYSVDGTTLYGMEDEQSKININEVEEQVLINLLKDSQVEDAENLASSILIWSGKKPDLAEGEEAHYQSLDLPYRCKKEKFKSIVELLLVRYMTPEILYGEDKDDDGKISEDEEGIVRYITVYTEDKAVNINTASERVLSALITGTFPDYLEADDLVYQIVEYRKGDDRIGNEDDGWFSTVEVNNLSGEPAKNLTEGYHSVKSTPFTPAQWSKLQNLASTDKLCVKSDTYTVHADAEVRKVRKSITATVDLSSFEQIKYLDWRRN